MDYDLPLPCIQLQEEDSSGDEGLPRLEGGTTSKKRKKKVNKRFCRSCYQHMRVWFSFRTRSDNQFITLIYRLVEQKLIQMACWLGDRADARACTSSLEQLTDWKGIAVFVLAESEE